MTVQGSSNQIDRSNNFDLKSALYGLPNCGQK
jgi:hypothetical protein